jgi:UPF0755 protein
MPETTRKYPFQPINNHPSGLKIRKKRLPNRHPLLIVGCVLVVVIITIIVATFIWYQIQLFPVGGDQYEYKKIKISSNITSSQISKELEKQSIIRNSFAFDVYIRLSGKGTSLQAGTYRLSPAESVPQIVDHFVKGSIDQFNIMFYPGATLTDSTVKSKENKQDVTSVLEKAGYSVEDISDALKMPYHGPLFDGKPPDVGLEGYVYGDTYSFNNGATVQEILQRTFDKFYTDIKDNNLIIEFKKHGLNLYQAITLASIIQREASNKEEQRQVAQVFYSRLSKNMPLGSDVTYQYIADKIGAARNPNIDSPYNTRRFTGLPPGPISVPGLSALKAVANPASGDYLYFLSGDDNVTHFARTNTEHEANIVKYCKVKCSVP